MYANTTIENARYVTPRYKRALRDVVDGAVRLKKTLHRFFLDNPPNEYKQTILKRYSK
jgi:hypothetical protein